MTRLFLMSAGGLLVLMIISGMLLMRDMRFQENMGRRIRSIHGERDEDNITDHAEVFRGMLTRLTSSVGTAMLRSGIIPAGTKAELEQTLATAGLRGPQGLNVFLGCKAFAPFVLAGLGWLLSNHVAMLAGKSIMVIAGFAILGLIAPDWIIGKRRKMYLARIEMGLPDALDLMVICAQSGLSLGPSVVRVAEELSHSYRDLAREFAQTASELQIMTDSRQALLNLGTRTGIDSFKRFTTTLIQTMQYGTPISVALQVLSAEIRQEVLTRFEERAARLPVILTMPMIVFILPCVFIIAAGPAMLQVTRSMAH